MTASGVVGGTAPLSGAPWLSHAPLSWPYGVLFTGLGAAQLGTAVAILARPVRRRVLLAAAAALAAVVLWALVRLAGILPAPDPWVPVSSVIGFTGDVCAGLQAVGGGHDQGRRRGAGDAAAPCPPGRRAVSAAGDGDG